MKVITKYVANNGIEFATEKECVEQDALIVQVEKIMIINVKPQLQQYLCCR